MPKRIQELAKEPGSSDPCLNLLVILCYTFSVLGGEVFSFILKGKSPI